MNSLNIQNEEQGLTNMTDGGPITSWDLNAYS